MVGVSISASLPEVRSTWEEEKVHNLMTETHPETKAITSFLSLRLPHEDVSVKECTDKTCVTNKVRSL